MFADLAGSTALSTRLDPEDMREILFAYQNAVSGAVARFEEHVAKMGDGVLAYLGGLRLPRARHHPAGSLVTAVGQLTASPGEPLATRVGIARAAGRSRSAALPRSALPTAGPARGRPRHEPRPLVGP